MENVGTGQCLELVVPVTNGFTTHATVEFHFLNTFVELHYVITKFPLLTLCAIDPFTEAMNLQQAKLQKREDRKITTWREHYKGGTPWAQFIPSSWLSKAWHLLNVWNVMFFSHPFRCFLFYLAEAHQLSDRSFFSLAICCLLFPNCFLPFLFVLWGKMGDFTLHFILYIQQSLLFSKSSLLMSSMWIMLAT